MSVEKAKKRVPSFEQGDMWRDDAGDPLNAHGCGVLKVEGTYYLYGEYKKGVTKLTEHITDWDAYYLDALGFSCYSSEDLVTWTFRGFALEAEQNDVGHDLYKEKVMERPKVIYNDCTGKYVMWFHVDDRDYKEAKVGVAVSDAPTGPFEFLGSFRPNGNESRDLTVFADDDGRAYLIYSSEDNKTLRICRLAEDGLSCTDDEVRLFVGRRREAPAVFKHKERYYMLTSGCTGWDANPTLLSTSAMMLGSWEDLGEPCCGPREDYSFDTQFTFVLSIDEAKGRFLAMADRWNKVDLENSTYVWLPFNIHGGETKIHWNEHYSSPFITQ